MFFHSRTPVLTPTGPSGEQILGTEFVCTYQAATTKDRILHSKTYGVHGVPTILKDYSHPKPIESSLCKSKTPAMQGAAPVIS